jgi:hypothetical protein
MVEHLIGLLAGVPNPFAQVRVGSAWDAFADVDAINARPFQRCLALVDDVVRSGASHGLLISGLAGTGKTHLLTRVRRQLIEQERGWFVYVPPVTAPDRFFRHVLQYLAEDVLRTARQGVAATQLETAVVRHFMADGAASTAQTADWWQRVRAEHPPGEALRRSLRGVFDPVTEALQLDGPVMRVLACHLAGVHRLAARDWLLGVALPEDDLRDLGVAVTLDEEERARSAVFTLLRLAAPHLVVLLAFDQIEGLRLNAQDTEPLVAFGLGVRALLDGASNALVVTCAQVSFLPALSDALGVALFERGVAEQQASLTTLVPAEARTLVVDRLRRAVDLQTVRAALRGAGDAAAADDLWPLDGTKLSSLLAAKDRPASDILLECRAAFEERRAALIGPTQAKSPEEPSPEGTLDDALGTAIAFQRCTPDIIDDGVYSDGLTRAVGILATDAKSVPLPQAARKDAALAFTRGGCTTGVSICNARNMQSLAARFARLLALRSRFDRLVLVRDARLPISPTAAATNARLKELQQSGCLVVRPAAEAYAALAAVRRLLAEAAAGDLTIGSRAVPVEELAAWLAREMPDPVRDFCADVLGEDQQAELPALATLQALLQDEGVLELSEAADRANVSKEAARQAATAQQELLGYLPGPPEALYARVAGLRRD